MLKQPTVKIKHPGFPDGVLINQIVYDETIHELFDQPEEVQGEEKNEEVKVPEGSGEEAPAEVQNSAETAQAAPATIGRRKA